jgi:hypothetical protein
MQVVQEFDHQQDYIIRELVNTVLKRRTTPGITRPRVFC